MLVLKMELCLDQMVKNQTPKDGYDPRQRGWLAVTAMQDDVFDVNTMPLLKTQAILAVVFILFLSAFVFFLVKRSLSPIHTIQDKLVEVFRFVTHKESNRPNKLIVTTKDEFGTMSNVINANIDEVVEGMKRDNAIILLI